LSKYLDRYRITDNIIDVGCGNIPFEPATYVLDFKDVRDDNRIVFKYDLDFDKFPVSDNYFNFVYSRHTLEDIQNPQNAFNELCRVSPRGYIETPSPLIELSRGVDVFGDYRGYHHHRYIIWSNVSDNTLHFLPKYPLVENISIDRDTEKVYNFIGNNYPLYWNNYYFWDVIIRLKWYYIDTELIWIYYKTIRYYFKKLYINQSNIQTRLFHDFRLRLKIMFYFVNFKVDLEFMRTQESGRESFWSLIL